MLYEHQYQCFCDSSYKIMYLPAIITFNTRNKQTQRKDQNRCTAIECSHFVLVSEKKPERYERVRVRIDTIICQGGRCRVYRYVSIL